MTENWKRQGVIFVVWGVLIALFSTTSPFGIPFDTIFPVLITPLLIWASWLLLKTPEILEEPEEVVQMREDIALYEKTLDEQYEVIKEYEDIFDSQLVELPCVCGGNTFRGLFSPTEENIVECESCHDKYRVTLTYDSILISEPMDQKTVVDKLENINSTQ